MGRSGAGTSQGQDSIDQELALHPEPESNKDGRVDPIFGRYASLASKCSEMDRYSAKAILIFCVTY